MIKANVSHKTKSSFIRKSVTSKRGAGALHLSALSRPKVLTHGAKAPRIRQVSRLMM